MFEFIFSIAEASVACFAVGFTLALSVKVFYLMPREERREVIMNFFAKEMGR